MHLRKNYLLFILLLLLVGPTTFAQKFSDKPEEFGANVQAFLEASNNERSKATSAAFLAAWSGFSESEQTLIIKIAKKMVGKGFTANGTYTDFFNSVANAGKNSQFDDYLEATDKMVSKYDFKTLTAYFQRMDGFFYDKLIFSSGNTKMYAIEGTFNIEYLYDTLMPDTLFATDPPLVNTRKEGAVVVFSNTNLHMTSAFDSTSLNNTSGIYYIISDVFEGKGGRFDWADIYLVWKRKDTEGVQITTREKEYPSLSQGQIYAEMGKFIIEAVKPRILSRNSFLNYAGFLPNQEEGSFEYFSQKRNLSYVYENYVEEGVKKKRAKDTITVADFPKYSSNNEEIEITNLGNNVLYKGALSLEGMKGLGTKKYGYATFTGFKNNAKTFNVRSKRFELGDSTVGSKKARFAIFLAGGIDSIYHNSIDFAYNKNHSAINMVRDRVSSLSIYPFINTHHKMYMDVDLMRYDLEKDSLDFYMFSLNDDLIPVVFESFNFFDLQRFNDLTALYDFHPARLFLSFSQDVTSFPNGMLKNPRAPNDTLDISTMALSYKKDEKELRGIAEDLMREGYVEYNEDLGQVIVGPRSKHAVQAERFYNTAIKVNRDNYIGSKKGHPLFNPNLKMNPVEDRNYYSYDFDDMYIKALRNDPVVKALKLPNASMSIAEASPILTIRGIDTLPISRGLKMYMIPRDSLKSVELLGGINGAYVNLPEGEVNIGDVRYQGRGFFLNYDLFNMEMQEIDHIIFQVKDSLGNVLLPESGLAKQHEGYGYEVVYEKTGGSIAISPVDENGTGFATNRSGLKQGEIKDYAKTYYSTYPKLNLPDGGYVDFDTETRAHHAYDTTKIRFIAPEIKLDSLYIKEPIFPGIFGSNIFPPFKENLVGLTDGSMGFNHSPPGTGYNLYPNKSEAAIALPKLLAEFPDLLGSQVEKRTKQILGFYPDSSSIQGARMNFEDKLKLDVEGLHSIGMIDYLSSKVNTSGSAIFLYTPDSVSSEKVKFEIARNEKVGVLDANFPQASGKNARMFWLIERDSLLLINEDNIRNLDNMYEEDSDPEFAKLYKNELFTIYGEDGFNNNDPVTLRGRMIIQAKGLLGNGIAVRKDFMMPSLDDGTYFRFQIDSLSGTKTDLKVNSRDNDPYDPNLTGFYSVHFPVLEGNYVDFKYNLNEERASIRPNSEAADFAAIGGFSFIKFPYAFYKTSISEAIWDSKNGSISMQGDSTSTFSSTRWGNESYDRRDLRFNGSKAFYDINKLRLIIDGVPDVHTADAKVLPDSNRVVILDSAKVETLVHAKLIMDTLTQYHNLFEGRININSRVDFTGIANYKYTNDIGQEFDIQFEEFRPLTLAQEDSALLAFEKRRTNYTGNDYSKKKDKNGILDEEKDGADSVKKDKEKKNTNVIKNVSEDVRTITYSQGYVGYDKKEFFVTTNILFRGKAMMYANKKQLALEGEIKPRLKSSADTSWIPFTRTAGERGLVLSREFKDNNGQLISSGLHFETASSGIYTNFISPKQQQSDKDIFMAEGELTADTVNNQYQILSTRRRDGLDYSGNVLTYDDDDGTMQMEGQYNLLDSLGEKFVRFVGDATFKSKDDCKFSTLMYFDLPIPTTASQSMAEDIVTKLEPKSIVVPRGDTVLLPLLADIVSDKGFQDYFINSDKRGGQLSITEGIPAMLKPVVFSNVNFQWSSEYLSFHSKGKLKLLNLYNRGFDQEVEGFVEIKKITSGDSFAMYFEVGDSWYFFEFENNVLFVGSSNSTFNDAILSKQLKKKKEGEFAMELADEGRKEGLLSRRSLYETE